MAEDDPEVVQGGAVDPPDDDALFPVEGGKVNLTQIATEQIYLNLSRKPICSETCKGLCPDCGVNRNTAECRCSGEDIDPRLAPLLKFRQN